MSTPRPQKKSILENLFFPCLLASGALVGVLLNNWPVELDDKYNREGDFVFLSILFIMSIWYAWVWWTSVIQPALWLQRPQTFSFRYRLTNMLLILATSIFLIGYAIINA